jgi:hypothetical protein
MGPAAQWDRHQWLVHYASLAAHNAPPTTPEVDSDSDTDTISDDGSVMSTPFALAWLAQNPQTPRIPRIPAYHPTQTPEWVEIRAGKDQLEADLSHCEAVLEKVTEHLKQDPDNKLRKENFNAAWAARMSAAKKVREEDALFCVLSRAIMRSGDKR